MPPSQIYKETAGHLLYQYVIECAEVWAISEQHFRLFGPRVGSVSSDWMRGLTPVTAAQQWEKMSAEERKVRPLVTYERLCTARDSSS